MSENWKDALAGGAISMVLAFILGMIFLAPDFAVGLSAGTFVGTTASHIIIKKIKNRNG